MKKEFVIPEMEIVRLEDVDIICASGCTHTAGGTDETDLIQGL